MNSVRSMHGTWQLSFWEFQTLNSDRKRLLEVDGNRWECCFVVCFIVLFLLNFRGTVTGDGEKV